jgi:deoxyribodipyrimidine photo-lyase
MIEEISLHAKRVDRHAQLRALFPDATGEDCVFEGGRSAALVKLRHVDPVAYNRTRNHIDGAVTRLSPYFRHGIITLREAAEYAIGRSGKGAYKFVFELAWRDYWRRVWWKKGDAIRNDIEAPKVPVGNAPLADDIVEARTGLACMDAFVGNLRETGYVHNHARMWFASYVIHHRKIDWRAAADWYYGELVDGDWASNHLSWQWVGSTFSHKPYFFNKENLERYTDGRYCRDCRAACPFDASYAELEIKLFSRNNERLP